VSALLACAFSSWVTENEEKAHSDFSQGGVPISTLQTHQTHQIPTATRVDRGGIAWRIPPTDGPDRPARAFRLHYSADAGMRVTGGWGWAGLGGF
jgi:hypothetical protein